MKFNGCSLVRSRMHVLAPDLLKQCPASVQFELPETANHSKGWDAKPLA